MAHTQSQPPPGNESTGVCTPVTTVAPMDTTVRSQISTEQEVQKTAGPSVEAFPQLCFTLPPKNSESLVIPNGLVAAVSSDDEDEPDCPGARATVEDALAQAPTASTSQVTAADPQRGIWEGGVDRLIRIHPDDEPVPASIIDAMPEKLSPRVAVETYSSLCRHLEPDYWRAVTKYAQNLPDHSKAGMEALSRFAEVAYIRANGVYTMMCSRYDNHLRYWATTHAARSLTKKDLESSRRQLRRRKQDNVGPLKPHPPTVFVIPPSPQTAETGIEEQIPELMTDDQRFTATVNVTRKKSAKTKQKGATGNRSLQLHASEQIAKGVFNDATKPNVPGTTDSSSRRKALPAEHTMIVQALTHADATRDLSYERDLFADANGPNISFLPLPTGPLVLTTPSVESGQETLEQGLSISAPLLPTSVSQAASLSGTEQHASMPEQTTNEVRPANAQAATSGTTKSNGKRITTTTTTAAAAPKKKKASVKAPARPKVPAKPKATATAAKAKVKPDASTVAKAKTAPKAPKSNGGTNPFGAPVALSAPAARQDVRQGPAPAYPHLNYATRTAEARDQGNGHSKVSWIRPSSNHEIAQAKSTPAQPQGGYNTAQHTPRMMPDTSTRHAPTFSMAGVAFPWIDRDPSAFAGESFFSRPFTQEITTESTAVWPQVPQGVSFSRMAVIHGLPYELVATDPFRIYVLVLHLLRQLGLSSLSHTARLISTISSIPISNAAASQVSAKDENVNGATNASNLVPTATHSRRGWAWIIFNSTQHRNSFLQTYAQKIRAGWLPPALSIEQNAADQQGTSRSSYLIYSAETYLGIPNTSQQAALESQRSRRVGQVQNSLSPASIPTQSQALTITLPIVPISTRPVNGDGFFQSYSQMMSSSGPSVASNWATASANRLAINPYMLDVQLPAYSSLPPSLFHSTSNPINAATAAAPKRKREDSVNTTRSANTNQSTPSFVPWQGSGYAVTQVVDQNRQRIPSKASATFFLRPSTSSPAVASNAPFASTHLPSLIPNAYQFGSQAGVHSLGSTSLVSQCTPPLAFGGQFRSGSMDNNWGSPSPMLSSAVPSIQQQQQQQQQSMWPPSAGVNAHAEQTALMDSRMSAPPTYVLQGNDADTISVGTGSQISFASRYEIVGSEDGSGHVHPRLRNASASALMSNTNGTGPELSAWRPQTAVPSAAQGTNYAANQDTNMYSADAPVSSFYTNSTSGLSPAHQNTSHYGDPTPDQRFASSNEASGLRVLHNGGQLYESRSLSTSSGHAPAADAFTPAGRTHDAASPSNTMGSYLPVESRLPDSYMRSTSAADQLYNNASNGGGGNSSGRGQNLSLLSNCAPFGAPEHQVGTPANMGVGSGAELAGPGDMSVGSTTSF